MKRAISSLTVTIATAAIFAAPAYSASPGTTSEPASPGQGNVSFISGGVGEDEAASMLNIGLLNHFAESVSIFCENGVQDREARMIQEAVQAAYLSVEEKRKVALPLRRTISHRSRLKEFMNDR